MILKYESSWGKFANCCSQRQADPFCWCIEHVFNLPSEIFENGLEELGLTDLQSLHLTRALMASQ